MENTNVKILEKQPSTFCVTLPDDSDRIDCAWFNPIIGDKIEGLVNKNKTNRKNVKLGIIADVNGGKRLPKGTVIQEGEGADSVPYVRATDVKNLKINLENAVKIPKEIHKIIQNYQLKKEDLAITIVGTIGEVGILEEDAEVVDFTENIARIRVKDSSIMSRFLLYYLDSEYGKIQTEKFFVGSLQYKLSLQSCRNIEVYLPFDKNKFDIKKQRQILNTTDAIFKEAKSKFIKSKKLIEEAHIVIKNKINLSMPQASDKSETYIKNLDLILDGRLDALFNHPLRDKLLNILKKYPNKKLGDLVKFQDKNKIVPSDYYRLVELEQIDEETGRIVKYREVPELGSEKVLLKKGSILISKLQPEKGKIAIVSDEYDGCVGSSELIPIVLNSKEISLEYLWVVLRSDYILKQWEYQLTGSSRMRIGPNEIKNTIIPIPEKRVQGKIVKEVINKIKLIDITKKDAEELVKKAKQKFLNLLIS